VTFSVVSPDRAAELKELSRHWPSLTLDEAQLGDLDLLISGALAEPVHPQPTEAPAAWRDPEGNLLAVRDHDGNLELLRAPVHHDHLDLRVPPSGFDGAGRVAVFLTRPLSRESMAHLLGHSVALFALAGESSDIDPYTLVRCLRATLPHFADGAARLVVLPFVLPAEPTASLAAIAGAYGCDRVLTLDAEAAPTYLPEVQRELDARYPPRGKQGFTVFFTGLSGSGKSTIANAVRVKLRERDSRSVTLLDGDLVRRMLSSELTFSREHRDLNILRIGFVAAEVTRAGGIAICSPIAPYAATRAQVRAMVAPHGGFVLVHVTTPLDVCEARDVKGLYAKARAGLIANFTGISDPYEVPEDAALTLDASRISPEEAANAVISHLESEGYLCD
jgi:adenylyl-sulfate kinase